MSGFLDDSIRVQPVNLKICMLHHMNMTFLIFPNFLAVRQQNNHAWFPLLWKENLLSHQKVSIINPFFNTKVSTIKYYEYGCSFIYVVSLWSVSFFIFTFIMINRVISWIKDTLAFLFSFENMSYNFWMITWMKNVNNFEIAKVQLQSVA